MPETTKKSRSKKSADGFVECSYDELVTQAKANHKRDSLTDEIGMHTPIAAQEKSAPQTQLTDKQTAELINKQSNMGRPTKYSLELASHICELIADGNPLRRITKMEGMPTAATVYVWLQQHKDFLDMYTRAREDQADALADEIVAIADEQPELVQVYDKDGKLVEVKIDSALLTWQRNRMDARKWTAAKLKPRKYGERQILAGDAENPLEVKQNSEMLDALVTNLQLSRQGQAKG
jgi:hypothetical protein